MDVTRRDLFKGGAVVAASLAAAGVVGVTGCSPSGGQAAGSGAAQGGATQPGITAAEFNAKWAFEVPPAPIENIAEEIEAEVIVVGAGTAGLVCANSLLEEGVDVLLITASTTPISRGGSNHATMSKVKKRFDLPKDDELLFEREIIENGMGVDQRKWYKFYNGSEEAMDWLIDIMEEKGFEWGLEQQCFFLDGPGSNYFNVVGAHGVLTKDSPTMGMNQQFIVDELAARLEAAGKPVHYKTIGRQLVRGGVPNGTSGRVEAIIAEREDGTFAKYVGTKAIVLATGDFSSNRDMMYKYAPEIAPLVSDEIYDGEVDYDRAFAYGGLYPGDGQRMGLWVGAAWQKIWPCCPMGGGINTGPANKFLNFSGLRVNRYGKRYMREYGLRDTAGCAGRNQPGSVVYALWNTDYAHKFPLPWLNFPLPYGSEVNFTADEVIAQWDKAVEGGTMFKADTIEELIELLELPKEDTLATVTRYNELCAKGEDEDFHKDPRLMISLEEGPFYGSIGNDTRILTILGGLRTGAEMEVCDAEDNPIEGLYNIGTMVGDMYGVNYDFQLSGLNLGATCVTFGYHLGKYLAKA